jgi:hypothetical protein
MNRKVITNYRIDNPDPATESPKNSPTAKVIAQPTISTSERKISPAHEKGQPKLHVIKNAHGVVTSLQITCVCGEEITVLLDYE